MYEKSTQEQPPEVFYKKVFLKILQNSRKTTVPESLFNKVAGLRPETLLKIDSGTGI